MWKICLKSELFRKKNKLIREVNTENLTIKIFDQISKCFSSWRNLRIKIKSQRVIKRSNCSLRINKF